MAGEMILTGTLNPYITAVCHPPFAPRVVQYFEYFEFRGAISIDFAISIHSGSELFSVVPNRGPLLGGTQI